MKINNIYCGNWIDLLSQLENNSINFCMTSPPYWALRSYLPKEHKNKYLEIGTEEHPQNYINNLVKGFEILKNKLTKDGSFYLNIGDSYFGGGTCGSYGETSIFKNGKLDVEQIKLNIKPDGKWLQIKQLLLIPSRLAISIQNDGWILRNDIIWFKPFHMPSPVQDRLTNTYEHIFHFVKSKKYYYNLDAIRIPHTTFENRPPGIVRNKLYNYKSKLNLNPEAYKQERWFKKTEENPVRHGISKKGNELGLTSFQYSELNPNPLGKNPGDLWRINLQPSSTQHFAQFPQKLCRQPILSSCPKDGVVLDPFCGAGNALIMAKKLERNYLGFDLNEKFVNIAKERLNKIPWSLEKMNYLKEKEKKNEWLEEW